MTSWSRRKHLLAYAVFALGCGRADKDGPADGQEVEVEVSATALTENREVVVEKLLGSGAGWLTLDLDVASDSNISAVVSALHSACKTKVKWGAQAAGPQEVARQCGGIGAATAQVRACVAELMMGPAMGNGITLVSRGTGSSTVWDSVWTDDGLQGGSQAQWKLVPGTPSQQASWALWATDFALRAVRDASDVLSLPCGTLSGGAFSATGAPTLAAYAAETASTTAHRLKTTEQSARSVIQAAINAARPNGTEFQQAIARGRGLGDSILTLAKLYGSVPTERFEPGTPPDYSADPYFGAGLRFPVVTHTVRDQADSKAEALIRRTRIDLSSANPTLRFLSSSEIAAGELEKRLVTALVEDDPTEYGAADPDDAVDELEARGYSSEVLRRAAVRIVQQAEAAGQSLMNFPESEETPPRIPALEHPRGDARGAYVYAITEGFSRSLTGEDSGVNSSYALRGVFHALDRLRGFIQDAQSRVGASEQAAFQEPREFIEQYVDGRVEVSWLWESGAPRVWFRVMGYAASSIPDTQRFEIWSGEKGLECALSGSIDGEPCNVNTWRFEVETSDVEIKNGFSATGLGSDAVQLEISDANWPSGLPASWWGSGARVYLTERRGGGRVALAGATLREPQTPTGVATFSVPVGPWMSEALADAVGPENYKDYGYSPLLAGRTVLMRVPVTSAGDCTGTYDATLGFCGRPYQLHDARAPADRSDVDAALRLLCTHAETDFDATCGRGAIARALELECMATQAFTIGNASTQYSVLHPSANVYQLSATAPTDNTAAAHFPVPDATDRASWAMYAVELTRQAMLVGSQVVNPADCGIGAISGNISRLNNTQVTLEAAVVGVISGTTGALQARAIRARNRMHAIWSVLGGEPGADDGYLRIAAERGMHGSRLETWKLYLGVGEERFEPEGARLDYTGDLLWGAHQRYPVLVAPRAPQAWWANWWSWGQMAIPFGRPLDEQAVARWMLANSRLHSPELFGNEREDDLEHFAARMGPGVTLKHLAQGAARLYLSQGGFHARSTNKDTYYASQFNEGRDLVGLTEGMSPLREAASLEDWIPGEGYAGRGVFHALDVVLGHAAMADTRTWVDPASKNALRSVVSTLRAHVNGRVVTCIEPPRVAGQVPTVVYQIHGTPVGLTESEARGLYEVWLGRSSPQWSLWYRYHEGMLDEDEWRFHDLAVSLGDEDPVYGGPVVTIRVAPENWPQARSYDIDTVGGFGKDGRSIRLLAKGRDPMNVQGRGELVGTVPGWRMGSVTRCYGSPLSQTQTQRIEEVDWLLNGGGDYSYTASILKPTGGYPTLSSPDVVNILEGKTVEVTGPYARPINSVDPANASYPGWNIRSLITDACMTTQASPEFRADHGWTKTLLDGRHDCGVHGVYGIWTQLCSAMVAEWFIDRGGSISEQWDYPNSWEWQYVIDGAPFAPPQPTLANTGNVLSFERLAGGSSELSMRLMGVVAARKAVANAGALLRAGNCPAASFDETFDGGALSLAEVATEYLEAAIGQLFLHTERARDLILAQVDDYEATTTDDPRTRALKAWRGRHGSRLEAAALYAGVPNEAFMREGELEPNPDDALDALYTKYPVVTAIELTEADSIAEQALRGASVHPKLLPEALRTPLGGGTPRFDVELFSQALESDALERYVFGTVQPNPGAFMAAHGFTTDDLKRAAVRMLQMDEVRGTGEVVLLDPGNPRPSAIGTARADTPNRAQHFMALTEGRGRYSDDQQNAEILYALRGTYHTAESALRAVRNVSPLVTSKPAVTLRLNAIAAQLSSLVQGRLRSVVYAATEAGMDDLASGVDLTMLDPPGISLVEAGQRFSLLEGDAGLQCALYSSIGGSYCIGAAEYRYRGAPTASPGQLLFSAFWNNASQAPLATMWDRNAYMHHLNGRVHLTEQTEFGSDVVVSVPLIRPVRSSRTLLMPRSTALDEQLEDILGYEVDTSSCDGCVARDACEVAACNVGLCVRYPNWNDGQACGEGVCQDGECTVSGCGDGLRSVGADGQVAREGCDDGNTESGDGCTSDCRPEFVDVANTAADEYLSKTGSGSVAEDGMGYALIVWLSDSQSGDGVTMYGLRRNPTGTPLGEPLVIEEDLPRGFDPSISVVGVSNGGWNVVYSHPLAHPPRSTANGGESAGGPGIVVRRVFEAYVGPRIRISQQVEGAQTAPRLARHLDGFVAVWTDYAGRTSPLSGIVDPDAGIRVRAFTRDGVPRNDMPPVIVPVDRSGEQDAASVAVIDGQVLVTWLHRASPSSAPQLRGRRFSMELQAVDTVDLELANGVSRAEVVGNLNSYRLVWRPLGQASSSYAVASLPRTIGAGLSDVQTWIDPKTSQTRFRTAPLFGGEIALLFEHSAGPSYAEVIATDASALGLETPELRSVLRRAVEGEFSLARGNRGLWFVWTERQSGASGRRNVRAFLLPIQNAGELCSGACEAGKLVIESPAGGSIVAVGEDCDPGPGYGVRVFSKTVLEVGTPIRVEVDGEPVMTTAVLHEGVVDVCVPVPPEAEIVVSVVQVSDETNQASVVIETQMLEAP